MSESLAVERLATQAESVRQFCAGVSDLQARWRPDGDSWSMLEVINHLADEESEDFRRRLDCILHRPDDPWPPIDPAGQVRQRRYNQRDLGESLERFSAARQESLQWLRSLDAPDLNAAVAAPWGGQFRAGDMLAAWVAHDLLHLRQLVELHYAWTAKQMQAWSVAYAGDW